MNGEKVLLADISQMDLACKKYKGRQCFPTAVAMIAYCVSGHSPDKMQKIHFHEVLQEGTDLYDTLIQLIETSTHPNHVYTRNVWERDENNRGLLSISDFPTVMKIFNKDFQMNMLNGYNESFHFPIDLMASNEVEKLDQILLYSTYFHQTLVDRKSLIEAFEIFSSHNCKYATLTIEAQTTALIKHEGKVFWADSHRTKLGAAAIFEFDNSLEFEKAIRRVIGHDRFDATYELQMIDMVPFNLNR